ncbi:MAG: C25 family peptidase propeptide domain-containing protein, partial [Ignavibacteriaceae bacterium]|nr:C25 family peptidase propeptide domain-containing protein [Ignavibacteriaceae bacterium]
MKLSAFVFCLILTILSSDSQAQSHKILESNNQFIKLEFDFNGKYKIKDTLLNGNKFSYISGAELSYRTPGEPWLPDYAIALGVPFGSKSRIEIVEQNQKKLGKYSILPFPDNDSYFGQFDLDAVDKLIYSNAGNFPKLSVSLPQTYQMRYANIQPVQAAPYQYNPVTRELVFNSKIIIKVIYDNSGQPNIAQ